MLNIEDMKSLTSVLRVVGAGNKLSKSLDAVLNFATVVYTDLYSGTEG
jgi:hypothetical protein